MYDFRERRALLLYPNEQNRMLLEYAMLMGRIESRRCWAITDPLAFEYSRHYGGGAIENSFHWVLDVTLHEHDSPIRLADSPQNRALLRHIALNILKRDPSNASLKQKRFRAGLDQPFLLNLLTNI